MKNSDSIELRDWLKLLILTSQKAYSALTEEERRYVSNLDDLSVPCQIEVL